MSSFIEAIKLLEEEKKKELGEQMEKLLDSELVNSRGGAGSGGGNYCQDIC